MDELAQFVSDAGVTTDKPVRLAVEAAAAGDARNAFVLETQVTTTDDFVLSAPGTLNKWTGEYSSANWFAKDNWSAKAKPGQATAVWLNATHFTRWAHEAEIPKNR